MQKPVQEVISLLFSDQPGIIADWAIKQLGLEESWRASNDDGAVEHVELRWAQSVKARKLPERPALGCV